MTRVDIRIMVLRLAAYVAVVLMGLSNAGRAIASPTVFPTGVTIYDKSKAYNAVDVLFAAPDQKTRLIDLHGHVLKTWDKNGVPARMVDPALVGGQEGVVGLWIADVPQDQASKSIAAVGLDPFSKAVEADKVFGLVAWNGRTLWSWGGLSSTHAALQHHDWVLLKGGNMLVLSDQMRRLAGFGDREVVDDTIYEVSPDGKIVWSWAAGDHLDEMGFSAEALKTMRASPDPDYLHINSMSVLGPNRWEKSGETRFAPDNIMICSRNANFTLIIERKTGHVVWEIGPDYPSRNPRKPETTPRPIDQISGQHDPHLIPEGLPGAGNILMFDNQGEAGFPPVPMQLLSGSRVLEINPASKQIVWEYIGADGDHTNFSFYSPFLGSVQRLPNGNTLIDEGIDGRFFQVTPAGETVWEYVSPFAGPAPQPPAQGKSAPARSSWTYRVQAVPLSWVP